MPARSHRATGETRVTSLGRLLALPLVATLAGALPLPAQPRDSAAVARAARGAQARFELYRLRHLPQVFGGGRPRCDEIIGRFCYWHDDEDPKPPDEPGRIRQARDSLIRVLDRAATALSGDPWIAGQRVRYLVEQQRYDEAVRAAESCHAGWWCRALEGFARHAASDFVGAARAYDDALLAMPEKERCAWRDISHLLEPASRDRYDDLSCAARERMESRFWWLAQPLHLLEANDVRSEHFARVTTARLEERARGALSSGGGADVRELRVRYGWPRHWWKERQASVTQDPQVVANSPSPSFAFLPSPRALDDPLAAREADWTIGERKSRHRYAPAYAASFSSLTHQTALFLRGDSLLVVSAYDVTRDTSFSSGVLRVGLVVSGESTERFSASRDSAGSRQSLVLTAPARPALLSVEVISPDKRAAARARFAVRPPPHGELTLSDLLIFDPTGELPNTLDDVLPRALASLRVPRGASLGLYWEVYGPRADDEALSATLEVDPADRSALRRAVEALRLAARPTRVRMRWQDAPSPLAHAAARTVAVNLSTLRPGRYRLTLTVSASDTQPVVSEREVEIVEPTDR